MRLFVQEIAEKYEESFKFLRENFRKLQDFTSNPLTRGLWTFLDLNLDGAVTDARFRHLLTFIPLDVIVTRVTGPGALTINYELFDRMNISITTTDACRVRLFIGRYEEGEIK